MVVSECIRAIRIGASGKHDTRGGVRLTKAIFDDIEKVIHANA